MPPLSGIVTRDHWYTVPLNHADPDDEQIQVFAREVVDRKKDSQSLPWLVFFQGGPGFAAPRPTNKSGWLRRALEDHRVLLLDQRGTGRSTPVDIQTLAELAPADQADYLQHFRADSIVRDAEWIRHRLCGEATRWTVYGQSFGGWCITTYLSLAPAALAAVLLTGGLPPIHRTADEVYQRTYPLVERKNDRYYARYPDDEPLVRRVVDHLAEHDVRLPSGDRLSPRRFQQLGLGLYRSSFYDDLHYLLEEAFVGPATQPTIGHRFLRQFENQFAFDTNPIFCLLHEAIYAQGAATRWAAERIRSEYPQFDAPAGSRVLFTGEMIYPWMFDEYRFLAPLKEAAERLARRDDWPPLYDLNVLAANTVPGAAVVYYEDMCVVRDFSLETAETIGNMKVWITNEYEHDASRVDGYRVLSRLLDMVHGDEQFAY